MNVKRRKLLMLILGSLYQSGFLLLRGLLIEMGELETLCYTMFATYDNARNLPSPAHRS